MWAVQRWGSLWWFRCLVGLWRTRCSDRRWACHYVPLLRREHTEFFSGLVSPPVVIETKHYIDHFWQSRISLKHKHYLHLQHWRYFLKKYLESYSNGKIEIHCKTHGFKNIVYIFYTLYLTYMITCRCVINVITFSFVLPGIMSYRRGPSQGQRGSPHVCLPCGNWSQPTKHDRYNNISYMYWEKLIGTLCIMNFK